MGQIAKIRRKSNEKIVKIAPNNLTNFEFEVHSFTGNGKAKTYVI